MSRLRLGRIAGVFGVRGWLKIQSFTQPVDNLLEYGPWWIAKGEGFVTRPQGGRVHGTGLVAQLCGADGQLIEDRDVAAGLTGSYIEVERSALPELPIGEFYWVDLVGLKVRNLEGVALGEVKEVTSNGAQEVLVLADGEAERLIPFVHGPIIKDVSLADGLIVADWQPEY
ncbi:MAG: ribosome maturation factor RimM [Panacagrimonas sp.]